TPRTSWCQGTVAAPGAVTGLTLAKQQGNPVVILNWFPPSDAVWYDVVAGPLNLLRSSQGNFNLATTLCAASRVSAPTAESSNQPPSGNGVWFLVRASNCRGRGTYGSAARDTGIAASRFTCP
ncbi:MAG TPA: hypothetical protein VJ826_08620, partial [Candidatus Polarisedimenticolaceae bacterium]|nr:hypothetical protein [Candidatus Polarisedimenticolaceae bacterium]